MPLARASLPSLPELERTIGELQADEMISEAQALQLRECLEEQLAGSGYVLKNLAVHLSIGVVFAFDVVPLPLGTIGRVGWVTFARLVETVRGNPEKARVHSPGVFLIAVIPWFGYAAYLLPLRRDSKELAFVIANTSWKARTGKSYEQFVASTSAVMSKFARWLVPLPWQS
jgi:hypothetical protein